MTTVTRTFTVDPPPETVIDYLKDFTNAEEWDPGTQRCNRNDSGPIAVGASWHNVSKFAGMTTELTYTLRELTADKIVLIGKNDTASSTDTITVLPHGSGSQITYRAELQLHGVARLTAPAVKVVFENVANKTEKRMTEVLNRL